MTQSILETIKSFGYTVNELPDGTFAIADPEDSVDGFYLLVGTIQEGYDEMNAMELFTVHP